MSFENDLLRSIFCLKMLRFCVDSTRALPRFFPKTPEKRVGKPERIVSLFGCISFPKVGEGWGGGARMSEKWSIHAKRNRYLV